MIHQQAYVKEGQLHWSGGTVSLPSELQGLNAEDLSNPYYWSGFTIVGSPW
jgi:CHAT domain-containing protein